MASYSDNCFADHGGAVLEASRRWSVAPEAISDFSANINPLGPPVGVVQALAVNPTGIAAYPDSSEFVSSLAAKLGISPENIVMGNGASGLIFAAVRALRSKRALLLEPAFSEYRRSLRAAEAGAERILLGKSDCFQPNLDLVKRTLKLTACDLLFLNNPHNPSGAVVLPELINALAIEASAAGASLIVDEAFVDYFPQASVLPEALSVPNIVVIRSLTKFYAMPGLRIGYAVCCAELASRIREQIEAWPVSGIALTAAKAAIADSVFEDRSRRQNEAARARFISALDRLRLMVFPSAANFLLASFQESRSGSGLARWLEPHRVLIRRCDSFAGLGDSFVRLAVRSEADNARLAELIEQWIWETSN